MGATVGLSQFIWPSDYFLNIHCSVYASMEYILDAWAQIMQQCFITLLIVWKGVIFPSKMSRIEIRKATEHFC